VAERHPERLAIQCKHWKAWTVTAPRVRELYGVVKGGNFTGGWLITSGAFTSAARSWARGKELRLIDGEELIAFVAGIELASRASNTRSAVRANSEYECPNCGVALQPLTNTKDGSKFWGCPSRTCGWTFNDAPAAKDIVLCDRGHPMVARWTKRGRSFWGCSMYPTCQRKRLTSSVAVKPS
jgi:restriction system protein